MHGYSEPAVFYRQHVTPQPRPVVFADHGHGPGLQSTASGDDASESLVELTVSPTVNDADASSFSVPDSESAPVSEAPPASVTAAECSELPLANMKEKTPMCLINELARFNKVCIVFASMSMPSERCKY